MKRTIVSVIAGLGALAAAAPASAVVLRCEVYGSNGFRLSDDVYKVEPPVISRWLPKTSSWDEKCGHLVQCLFTDTTYEVQGSDTSEAITINRITGAYEDSAGSVRFTGQCHPDTDPSEGQKPQF